VIGQVEGDGAVCEGFSASQITSAIEKIMPDHVIWVGKPPDTDTYAHGKVLKKIDTVCKTFEDGRKFAREKTDQGSIVLAVKTWR
jgi:hypothetical protein